MIKVAVRLFSQNEKNHIEMVMHHLSNRSAEACVLGSVSESDLIVISPSDPSFEAIIRAYQTRRKGPMPVIYESALNDQLVYESLNITPSDIPYLPKPATMEGLSRLIEFVSDSVARRNEDDESDNRPCGLCSILSSAATQEAYLEIRGKKTPPIFVDGSRGQIVIARDCLEGAGLSDEFKAALKHDSVFASRTIKDKRFMEKLADETVNCMIGLDHLLWALGYQYRMNTQRFTEPFGLNAWPDFGRLPYQPADLRLAAYLTQAKHTVTSLLEGNIASEEVIERFLSAAKASGLLNNAQGEMQAVGNHNAKPVNQGLLKRLIRRFF